MSKTLSLVLFALALVLVLPVSVDARHVVGAGRCHSGFGHRVSGFGFGHHGFGGFNYGYGHSFAVAVPYAVPTVVAAPPVVSYAQPVVQQPVVQQTYAAPQVFAAPVYSAPVFATPVYGFGFGSGHCGTSFGFRSGFRHCR